MIWPDDADPSEKALATADWKLDEIEKELRAQIELALEYIPHCSHVTPHMAFHQISPEVTSLLFRLVREYDLDANLRFLPLKELDLFGDAYTVAEKIENAVLVLEGLGSGTWEFYDNPGMNTPEMQQIWQVGERDVAFSGDAVTRVFTSEGVKNVIAERKIRLMGYRDLKPWAIR